MSLTFKSDATSKDLPRVVSALLLPLYSRQSNTKGAMGIKIPLAEESLLSIWAHLNLRGKYRGPENKLAIPIMTSISKELSG